MQKKAIQFPGLKRSGRIRAELADVQGLAAQVNRYRYSGMMFNSKLSSLRPVAFGPDGNRISFNEVVSKLRSLGLWPPTTGERTDCIPFRDRGGQTHQSRGFRRSKSCSRKPGQPDEQEKRSNSCSRGPRQQDEQEKRAQLMRQMSQIHWIDQRHEAKVLEEDQILNSVPRDGRKQLSQLCETNLVEQHAAAQWLLAEPCKDGDVVPNGETNGCGLPAARSFMQSIGCLLPANGKRHTKIPRPPQYQ